MSSISAHCVNMFFRRSCCARILNSGRFASGVPAVPLVKSLFPVAILLDQLLADRGDWQVSILGTDLNLGFLDRARKATYRQWSFRQTKIHEDPRYFSPLATISRWRRRCIAMCVSHTSTW